MGLTQGLFPVSNIGRIGNTSFNRVGWGICGLVGMAGDLTGTHEKAFKQMLIFDSVRGEDSTGILGVGKHSEIDFKLAKQVGNPFEVLETREARSIFQGSSRILMGHNRWATQGKVNKRNSHPYEFDTLVGAHNGTLENKWELPDAGRFDVDSENLYHSFETIGLEATMRKVRGAWALTWWDRLENTINFLRNDQRPLYYTLVEGKALAWASEEWMLAAALSRTGMKFSEIESFEVGVLYSLPVPKGGQLGKPVVKPVEYAPKKEPVVYQGTYPRHTPLQNQHANNVVKLSEKQNTASDNSPSTPTSPASKNNPNVKLMQEKGLLLEAVCLVKEQATGAEFVMCFAPEYPMCEVRLYRNNNGVDVVFNDIGCEFEGDISTYTLGADKKGFYKVSPSSIKIVTKSGLNSDDVTADEMYPDHKGVDMDYQSWRRKYGTCGFCCDNVEPTDMNEGARFTTQGYIFCKACAEDKEVATYVTFI